MRRIPLLALGLLLIVPALGWAQDTDPMAEDFPSGAQAGRQLGGRPGGGLPGAPGQAGEDPRAMRGGAMAMGAGLGAPWLMEPIWGQLRLTDEEFESLVQLHVQTLRQLPALMADLWRNERAWRRTMMEYPLNTEAVQSAWQALQNARESVFAVQLETAQRMQEQLGEARWQQMQERQPLIATSPGGAGRIDPGRRTRLELGGGPQSPPAPPAPPRQAAPPQAPPSPGDMSADFPQAVAPKPDPGGPHESGEFAPSPPSTVPREILEQL